MPSALVACSFMNSSTPRASSPPADAPAFEPLAAAVSVAALAAARGCATGQQGAGEAQHRPAIDRR